MLGMLSLLGASISLTEVTGFKRIDRNPVHFGHKFNSFPAKCLRFISNFAEDRNGNMAANGKKEPPPTKTEKLRFLSVPNFPTNSYENVQFQIRNPLRFIENCPFLSFNQELYINHLAKSKWKLTKKLVKSNTPKCMLWFLPIKNIQ